MCQQYLRLSHKIKFVVHVRSAMSSELARTQPKLEGNVAWKIRSHVNGVPQKIIIRELHCKEYISTMVMNNSKSMSAKKSYGFYELEKLNLHHAESVIIFCQMELPNSSSVSQRNCR